MANVQRLTKRVNELEEWVKENVATGGPQGILETFTYLVNEARANAQMRMQTEQNFNGMRSATFEFIQQHKLTDEWNEFLAEKEKRDNAVQEQSPEEVPSLDEAKDGEEVGEEDTKGKKPSKKSNKEKKD